LSIGGFDALVYLPPHFTETREEALLEHIERHEFALLTTHGETGMIASQVPILAEQRDGKVYLQGHLACGNPQCLDIYAGSEALVVFWGPHAYISPSWYTAGPAVPTWNYASVHAYGACRPMDDKKWLRGFLQRLSERHEVGGPAPWRVQDQPEGFIDAMMGGILGFEIAVSRLEGKFKLSQNRPGEDRPRIIAELEAREDSDANGVARLMRERET
jgi:transcriptional regulator